MLQEEGLSCHRFLAPLAAGESGLPPEPVPPGRLPQKAEHPVALGCSTLAPVWMRLRGHPRCRAPLGPEQASPGTVSTRLVPGRLLPPPTPGQSLGNMEGPVLQGWLPVSNTGALYQKLPKFQRLLLMSHCLSCRAKLAWRPRVIASITLHFAECIGLVSCFWAAPNALTAFGFIVKACARVGLKCCVRTGKGNTVGKNKNMPVCYEFTGSPKS